jgi:two-component system, sensor histidine kinase RpfC
VKERSGGTDLWDRRRAVIHSWYAILLSCAVFGFGGFHFMLIRTGLWSTAPYEAVGLAATLAVPPLVTGLLAFHIGFRRLGRVFAARPDSEHEQVMIRILLVSLNLTYVLVLILASGPAQTSTGTFNQTLADTFIGSVLILPPSFAGTWLLLVLLMLDPAPSILRRVLGNLLDMAMVCGSRSATASATAPGSWCHRPSWERPASPS